MEKFFLIALVSIVLISGCVSEPETPEPPVTPTPPPVVENTPEPPPLPPEPPPVIEVKDKCIHTLEIENFKFESNPTAVQKAQYNSCYNNNYILRLNSNSTKEICDEITDDTFLIKCYSTLSRKLDDTTVCDTAPENFVSIDEFPEKILVSEACKYQHITDYSHVLEQEIETELCESIENTDFSAYCLSRSEYYKNR